MKTCQFEWSGYPHEGCAEFGPPDEFRCDLPAKWKLTFENPVPMEGEEDTEVVYACDFHGKLMLDESFDDLWHVAKYHAPTMPATPATTPASASASGARIITSASATTPATPATTPASASAPGSTTPASTTAATPADRERHDEEPENEKHLSPASDDHVLTREHRAASCSCGWMVASRTDDGVVALVREHCLEFGLKISASD